MSNEVADTKPSRVRAKAEADAQLPVGPILGSCVLPEHVVKHSAQLANEFFDAQEAIDWSGDAVETYSEPLWLVRGGATWRPDLASLGLKLTAQRGQPCELVVSAGVNQHIDEIAGLVLMLVIHNDGLKFRQGRTSHIPKAGEFFLFDDRKSHGLSSGKKRETFIGWHMPVTVINSPNHD